MLLNSFIVRQIFICRGVLPTRSLIVALLLKLGHLVLLKLLEEPFLFPGRVIGGSAVERSIHSQVHHTTVERTI